jgi:hypothetical protein
MTRTAGGEREEGDKKLDKNVRWVRCASSAAFVRVRKREREEKKEGRE